MPLTFNKSVINPDQPQGRVAVRLRELLVNSSIRSSEELKLRTNYAGSTLSEAMSGRRRQTPPVITKIVLACVPDSAVADAEIEWMVAILEESPGSSSSWAARVGERRPGLPDTSLDERDDPGVEWDEPAHVVGWSDSSRGWRPRRWAHSHRRLALAGVFLVVLAVLGFGTVTALQPTYISDGSVNVTSDPTFGTIFAKIKAENDRVLSAPDHAPVVSIAYTDPFPAAHGPLSEQLLRELEGVYEVQLQRNEASGPDPLGGPPRVQLLVANLGDQAAQEATVVDQLRERADPSDPAPLVAVVGLDQSLPAVKDAVDHLGAAGIPMVAGRLAADDFAADAVDTGFFSVAPPVRDQVAAAARYLGEQARKPLLVEDTTTADLYGRNVAAQFEARFAAAGNGTPLPAPVPFNSSLPGLQTAFAQVLPAICTVQPDVVFFAGRGANLPEFVRELGTRVCPQVPVTVVTLSDGRELADALLAEDAAGSAVEHQLNEAMLPSPGNAGVRVILTAPAHPGIWADPRLVPPGAHSVLSGSFATAFPQQGFPGQPSIDSSGDVIMGHDAMLVVVEAIARSRPPQSAEPVTTGLVRQALGGITPYTPVYGASGPIAYNEAGYPVAKNIPITEISPYGQITLLSPTTP